MRANKEGERKRKKQLERSINFEKVSVITAIIMINKDNRSAQRSVNIQKQ